LENHHNCLHCGQTLNNKFCGNCGQKADTHRYNFKHFMIHDILHGIWHVEKGLFYTIKDLFVRGGKGVHEFLIGKRAMYYNYVPLMVIMIALIAIIFPHTQVKIADFSDKKTQGIMKTLMDFNNNFPKITMMIYLPFMALSSFLWFRKAKLNFTEHIVLECYKTIFNSTLLIIFYIICVFYNNVTVLKYAYSGIMFVSFSYSIWYYFGMFSTYGFSKKGIIVRGIMVYLTLQVIVIVITFICMIIVGYLVGRGIIPEPQFMKTLK
jgi:hypothetical protein